MRIIYVLRDPDGAARYVGVTRQHLVDRLAMHVSRARLQRDTSPKADWLRRLAARGESPTIHQMERVPSGVNVDERERLWIAQMIDDGAPLLNVRHGVAHAHRAKKNARGIAAERRRADARVAEAVARYATPETVAPIDRVEPATTPQRTLNRFGHYQDAAGRWRTPRGATGRGRARRLRSPLS